jgi:hypothetical protein
MLNIDLSLRWQTGRAVFCRGAGFGSRACGALVVAFFILCLLSGIFFCHEMPLYFKKIVLLLLSSIIPCMK